jgi:hypothetical protein
MSDASKPYKCTLCDMNFKLPQGLGRHMSTIHSNKTKVKSGSDALNGYKIKLENFEDASRELVAVIRALATEASVYKRERDDLAAFKAELSKFVSIKSPPKGE